MHASPLDHVKWFADPAPYPTRYDLLFTPPLLLALAVAAGAVMAAWWIERTFPEPAPVKALERLAGYGATALGLHLGVALTAAAVVGLLFVSSLPISTEATLGFAFLTIEAMCGLMILVGLATRAAALLLALLGILAMFAGGFTFESILEQVHILGIAAFLFLIGRGPLSLDRLRGVRPPLDAREVPAAALTLVRVAMGFGIAYSALTEKLLNPPLAQALLDERPWLNFIRSFGVADGQFAYGAGLTELVVGAVLMSPFVTRPTVLAGAVLFTSSLPFFGWSELLGHLPFYGIMLLLLIAPHAGSARVRAAMRPAS
ncbi:hypothetical protein BH18CHL2_BH18CHL2_05970 [soil metagenome]